MRILFLTPFLPDPGASHGGGSYIGALADGLRDGSELGLLHLHHAGQDQLPDSKWHWQASAPYLGAPTGLSHRLRMLWQWRSRPLLAAKYWQPELVAQAKRAIREFRPDIALVELAQMAQYLPALRGLPTILTDHEAGRPANASTGLGKLADRRDGRLWERHVKRYYQQASLVQAVTSEDASELTRQTGREVLVRPPTLPIPNEACQPGQAPPCALFLGDYRHGPNPEAATRIAKDIWPMVRATQPDAQLLLAGPNETPIRDLAELPGVQVLGYVEDLTELLSRARVVLAPLWSGRGFRVKNATALAYGLPIVTNGLGSRGCRAPSPACSVAESPEELAQATVPHLASAEFAAKAGREARVWAATQYAASSVARLQLDRIEKLLR